MAARHSTGETIVVNLRHRYHGGTAAALSQCGHHTWRFRAQPVPAVPRRLEPNCYRCPFGKTPDNCSLECAKNVETTIQTSTHGKIAAFIAEPVMGVGGFISPPNEYFHEVVKIVHKYGGKYISDEVQTGAGRCGSEFFLTKELGIDADMVTMAKGLGNGAAIGATMMKTEVSETLAGKMFFNTFGSDPYQTMQAKVTVEIIREEKLIENSRTMGKHLIDELKGLMKTRRLIGDVRGRGLLLGIEARQRSHDQGVCYRRNRRADGACREKGFSSERGPDGKCGPPGSTALALLAPKCDQIIPPSTRALRQLEQES